MRATCRKELGDYMKKYLFLTLIALTFTACVVAQGKEDYIPVGPQNLSIQYKEGKDLPVYTDVTQITRPWANIGVQRVKYLPNNPKVIQAHILKFQDFAAAHGGDAIIIKRYVYYKIFISLDLINIRIFTISIKYITMNIMINSSSLFGFLKLTN